MDVKDLSKLLTAVAEADINELTLETGEYKVTVKRGAGAMPQMTYAPVAAAPVAVQAGAPAAPTPAVSEGTAASKAESSEKPKADTSHLVDVTAPIVGTFYAASAPDAPDFVKVGDKVSAGTVLCIIEAMKLMNEIEAEVSGTIVEILVKNEDPVEYGQALFRIDPR
ncbi:MAG: acetyl-CoA carboxylase biotin carboxyl carrier protein [Trueperaceae bacterium]|nr:acetyl-CoA carboxylase biotin carboxyl carrier protein [Trueperaceae bacterium]